MHSIGNVANTRETAEPSPNLVSKSQLRSQSRKKHVDRGIKCKSNKACICHIFSQSAEKQKKTKRL